MNSELGHMWFMLNKIDNFVQRPPFKNPVESRNTTGTTLRFRAEN